MKPASPTRPKTSTAAVLITSVRCRRIHRRARIETGSRTGRHRLIGQPLHHIVGQGEPRLAVLGAAPPGAFRQIASRRAGKLRSPARRGGTIAASRTALSRSAPCRARLLESRSSPSGSRTGPGPG